MTKHLIHRQVLNLRYSNAEQAKADLEVWKERNERIFNPAISEVLDELEIPGKTIRIPKVEINLETFRDNFDADLLKKKFKEALKTKLLAEVPELKSWHLDRKVERESSRLFTDSTSEAELLRFMLEQGRKPWWAIPSKQSTINQLCHKLQQDENAIWKNWLVEKLLSVQALQRLHYHLEWEEIISLITWVFPNLKEKVSALVKILEEHVVPDFISPSDFHQILGIAFLKAAFLETSFPEGSLEKLLQLTLRRGTPFYLTSTMERLRWTFVILEVKNPTHSKEQLIQRILKKWIQNGRKAGKSTAEWEAMIQPESILRILKNLEKSEVMGSISETKNNPKVLLRNPIKPTPDQEEAMPISNAGLVLTGAFLPYFFKELGWIEKKNFVSQSAQNRAALILQFLLNRENAFEESELLLNKLLCGIELERPLPLSFIPTEHELSCCQNLVDSMASHWTALKSTSGKTLAKSFFPREGILKKSDKGYSLFVNRLSIDILLNRLPWTISITKLPWMQETLFTEW